MLDSAKPTETNNTNLDPSLQVGIGWRNSKPASPALAAVRILALR